MQRAKPNQLFVSLLQLKGGWRANHARACVKTPLALERAQKRPPYFSIWRILICWQGVLMVLSGLFGREFRVFTRLARCSERRHHSLSFHYVCLLAAVAGP